MNTVEPRHTTTPLLRPLIFLSENLDNPTTRYYDQRPPLGVLSRYFVYKIAPLIRPVKMFGGAAE